MVESVAIVGANLAGGRAAEALRQAGFEGTVTLIGEERWLPYERPPLSKEVLWDPTRLPETFFLHDEAWYSEKRIDLRLGQRAEALDLAGGGVRLAGGATVRADRIILATGGRARLLPMAGADAPNVHHLRTKDDADRLAPDLRAGARIVVIGMGVIGAEVAASARKAGCEVIAVEPAPVPMIRMLGRRFGNWLGQQHARHGVAARFGIGVRALAVDAGRVVAVELDDGSRIDCDAVVVGIGIVPAIELARDAGIEVASGIVVDRQCRTSHPNVFAAGDVAEQPGFFGGRARVETYQNAGEQAMAAAHALLGRDVDYLRPAWFWSDQYDLNIQVAGHIEDSFTSIVRGSPEEAKFTAFFLNDGVVEGVLTVNRAADMGTGRRLVERRVKADPAVLADEAVPMRSLLNPRPVSA